MRQATENILLNNSNYVPEGIDINAITLTQQVSKDINSKLLDLRNKYWVGASTKKTLDSIIDSVINVEFVNSINLFTDITCIIKKSKLKNKDLVATQLVSTSSGSESSIGGGIGGGGIGAGGIGGTGSSSSDSIDLEDIITLVESGYLYGDNTSILFGNNNFIEIP